MAGWVKCAALAAMALLAFQAHAQPLTSPPLAQQAPIETYIPEVGQAGKDVIWVPTPDALIKEMLTTAQVTAKDYVVDLGAGDGKIAIAAARDFGARAHGIEYNPDMVALAKRNAAAAGVSGKATFQQGDIFVTDFSAATVVTLYLLPSLNLKLRDTILAMKPGTRVVSNSFDMGDWKADKVISADSGAYVGYYWLVPARAGGKWRLDGGLLGPLEFTVKQTFQKVDVNVSVGGRPLAVADARLAGDKLSFTFIDGGARYDIAGTVSGDRFIGGFSSPGAKQAKKVRGERVSAG